MFNILSGDTEPEQVFTPRPDHVLVIGPLGEVYHADLTAKFDHVKSNIYVPKKETRRCLEVTPTVYTVLEYKSKDTTITTSWGAKHIVKPGDFIIMNGDTPDYRVKRTVFMKTYHVTNHAKKQTLSVPSLDQCDFTVIHVKGAVDRMQNIKSMRRVLQTKLHIFTGIDATRDLTGPLIERNKINGVLPENHMWNYLDNKPMKRSQLAIWLTHYMSWQWLLERKRDPKPFHVIFEDDSILQPNFMKLLHKYKSHITKNKTGITYLYVFPEQARGLAKGDIEPVFKRFWGLQCYVVPHVLIEKLLNDMKPMNAHVDIQMSLLKDFTSKFIFDDFLFHRMLPSLNNVH